MWCIRCLRDYVYAFQLARNSTCWFAQSIIVYDGRLRDILNQFVFMQIDCDSNLQGEEEEQAIKTIMFLCTNGLLGIAQFSIIIINTHSNHVIDLLAFVFKRLSSSMIPANRNISAITEGNSDLFTQVRLRRVVAALWPFSQLSCEISIHVHQLKCVRSKKKSGLEVFITVTNFGVCAAWIIF